MQSNNVGKFDAMKRLVLSVPVIMLSCWPGAVISAEARTPTNEHRPVCSPDGSKFVYMLQSERTDNDWELYQLAFSTQSKSV